MLRTVSNVVVMIVMIVLVVWMAVLLPTAIRQQEEEKARFEDSVREYVEYHNKYD